MRLPLTASNSAWPRLPLRFSVATPPLSRYTPTAYTCGAERPLSLGGCSRSSAPPGPGSHLDCAVLVARASAHELLRRASRTQRLREGEAVDDQLTSRTAAAEGRRYGDRGDGGRADKEARRRARPRRGEGVWCEGSGFAKLRSFLLARAHAAAGAAAGAGRRCYMSCSCRFADMGFLGIPKKSAKFYGLGVLGMREQFEAAMAAGELLEMLESLPRGAVEASVRLMRGYTRTGEWPGGGQSGPFSPALPRSAAARQAPQVSGQMDSARERGVQGGAQTNAEVTLAAAHLLRCRVRTHLRSVGHLPSEPRPAVPNEQYSFCEYGR